MVTLVFLNLGAVIGAQPSVPSDAMLQAQKVGPDTPWRWIEVEASSGGWSVTRGSGMVQLHGHEFRAELQLDANEPSGANLLLHGSIEHGLIRATEILLNTDAKPAAVSGTFTSERRGGTLAQRIGQSGSQMLAC